MFHYTVSKIKGPTVFCPAVASGHKVYAFINSGSLHGSGHIDVHVFNTVSLVWRKLPPVTPGKGERHLEFPSKGIGQTAVLVGDIVYLWGGWTLAGYSNMLYAYDVDTHSWFKPRVSGSVPVGREDHSACVLGTAMFIHGGCNNLTGHTNDIYKLDTSTMVWSSINTGDTTAPASLWHSATIIGTKMFVFGGEGKQGGMFYNTIRVFDTETNCWTNPNPSTQFLPERRRYHSAFTYNGELYIFGGDNRIWGEEEDIWGEEEDEEDEEDEDEEEDEEEEEPAETGEEDDASKLQVLWKFSPETFSWKEVKHKGNGPLKMILGCCCMVGDCVILFRGCSDKLFILDLSPSLKTLCKLAVIQYGLEQSELPQDIRWELAAMTNSGVI